MRVKAKLDLAGIKTWLLAHGEKLALAVVAVVVLMFTYSAIQRDVLDASKQPDNLEDLARTVADHVTASRWDAKREGVQLVDYTQRAKSEPVKLGSFALPTLFDPPPYDPKARRDDPEVLGVEDLRVGAGYDVFAMKPDAAAGGGRPETRPQAQPWAVVTGLVPFERQKQAYAQAFSHAVGADPKRDVPRYYWPLLERTEVDEAHPDKVKWTRVPAADKYEKEWATSEADEIVAKEYVDAELTGHLGSLANSKQKWGESVSHPKVPRKDDEFKKSNELVEPEPVEPKKEAQPDERGFEFVRQPASEKPKVRHAEPAEPKVVEYRLLRAFDYSVRPGKKYRYRVIIGLQNPNYDLPPQYVKNPESIRRRSIASKPSEPTPVVTIPDGHRVLAGAVDAGTRYSEPTATMLVTAIDEREGLEAATEMTKVYRGTLANTEERVVKVQHPTNHQITNVTLGFQSNILVLDIYGGRDLPGRKKVPPIVTPGEILLLDAAGNMMVRSEMDDQEQYESSIVRDPVETPKKAKPLLDEGRPNRQKRAAKK